MRGVAALLLAVGPAAAGKFPGCLGSTLVGCPSVVNCSEHWIQQRIDHFNWAAPLGDANQTTYMQRYFVNDQWWSKAEDGTRGPIFFYFGNEDNVELYVNHTGLMWESASDFGALLVFGEHRYYGKSLPFRAGTEGCMSWLTTEQAMADFAYLIDDVRQWPGAAHSAVIGFGGSYGGMLGAWFRVKYPNSVDGVIAASAPIWSFKGLSPPYDFNAFAKGVTFDASAAGGATDNCKRAVKEGYPRILAAGETTEGRALLQSAFRLCEPLSKPYAESARSVAETFSSGGNFANMAMGNYPYASSYLMHGKSLLPPWPVRTACSHLDRRFGPDDDLALFEGLREATATQLNNTGDRPCFDPAPLQHPSLMRKMRAPSPEADDPPVGSCQGTWGYQYCTEMTQPFVYGTPDDMYFCPNGTFYPAVNCSQNNTRWDLDGVAEGCVQQWGVDPRTEWARIGLAGKRLSGASNIVFSNGLLDPWHGGGILQNLSSSLLAVIIPNGAHHIDLMFSDPADEPYPDIRAAREFERRQMRRWVEEVRHRRA
eukprot:TRINITY_DN46874_c0_g1_i1.p1 TRINITY_DN46874_c0_g1~~TRINITY_DN46874_c0_g1_i1.p1  ORF type:complete len:558 (+),score=166.37 TRINITY_DN46874_c0_g1_i1:57-1676(+)